MATRSALRHRSAGRLLPLLVMAVLTGVLGMHGWEPAGLASPSAPHSGHAMMMAHSADVPEASGPCVHTDGGAGHLAHADAMCVASVHAPPALTAARPGASTVAASAVRAPVSARSVRAPPDLFELQLLRI